MIGRKIWRKEIVNEEQMMDDAILEIPYMDEIKYMTVKKMKEYGYVVLLSSIRLSMKSSKIVKRASNEVANIVKKKLFKESNELSDPKQVSMFLQMISDYKSKIRKIKKKIREEEGLK